MAGSLDQQLPAGPPFVPEVVPEPAFPEAARPPAPHSAPGKTAAIPRLPVRLREIVVLVLLVHRYNVARIMSGDPAPSVQISVYPISAEGVLALPPLAGCEDAIIRDGVCALLAERALAAESKAARRADEGWTAAQLADRLLLERLDEVRGEWEVYRDPAKRRAALARFHEYAYQWF